MLGAGYWMNARSGKLISVHEHGGEVMNNAHVYGLTPDDVEHITAGAPYNPYDSSKGSSRGKLIIAATKKGWVRVRTNSQGDWSLQLFGTADSAVRSFVKKLGRELGPYARIQISDFATGFQKVYSFQQLKQASKIGEFQDVGASGPAVGRDAAAETGEKADKAKANAIPNRLSDKQKRNVMRSRLSQQAGIPDRDVEESLKAKLLRCIREGVDVYDQQFPLAGKIVDGLTVGPKVSNTDSIAGSFNRYRILRGIRQVSMEGYGPPETTFYAKRDFDRSRALAEAIKESGRIDPLIVGVDSQGDHIIEGVHRLTALQYLKKKSFPALVVIDLDDEKSTNLGDVELR